MIKTRTLSPKSGWLKHVLGEECRKILGFFSWDDVVVHQITDCTEYIQLEVEVRKNCGRGPISFHRVILK